ncbi:MAG: hypothetical protein EKK55_01080 [Rhodocyclaceae bacterium]|nr:MAG: hypothetical protein EKK55_01080 [Rhodocyclaceae bacterium]
MNINHTISTDLVLKAAPWVQASKDAEAATAGVVKQAERLDTAIATKLNPHIKDLASNFRLTKDALFGYEQGLDRAARANDRFATSAGNAARASQLQQNLARAGGQFAQGVTAYSIGQIAQGAVSHIASQPVAGLVGAAVSSGLSVLPTQIQAVIASFAALAIAAKELSGSLIDPDRDINARFDAKFASIRAAEAATREAESRVGGLGARIADRESWNPSYRESVAFYEQKLTQQTQELTAARASLAEQEKLLASSQARIASLQAGRSAASAGGEGAAFNLARLANPGDESVVLGRVSQLATQARTLQSGGNQDAARAKFEEAQQLLQQLFQALGAPVERLGEFQAAIASLGAEIDASFVASMDATSSAVQSAAESVASLTTTVEQLGAAVTSTALNIQAANGLIAANAAEISAMQAQLTAAKSALGAAKIAESQAITAPIEGMAGGGRSVTDNQLALLSVGEVVLNRNQQNAIGGAAALRRAGVPGFAGGGGFQDMLEGTRRYTAASEAAGSIDASVARSQWNEMANSLMSQGLSYRQAWDTINRRRAAGLPPVFPGFTQTPTVASSLGNVQTFAEGGIVQPSSTVTMGDMHFDLRGAGANETTARDMAKTIRRQVRLGLSKLS